MFKPLKTAKFNANDQDTIIRSLPTCPMKTTVSLRSIPSTK